MNIWSSVPSIPNWLIVLWCSLSEYSHKWILYFYSIESPHRSSKDNRYCYCYSESDSDIYKGSPWTVSRNSHEPCQIDLSSNNWLLFWNGSKYKARYSLCSVMTLIWSPMNW